MGHLSAILFVFLRQGNAAINARGFIYVAHVFQGTINTVVDVVGKDSFNPLSKTIFLNILELILIDLYMENTDQEGAHGPQF